MDKNKDNASVIYTINAGIVDKSHWVNDKDIGGGRIIGEVCHFIDYLIFLLGKDIKNIDSQYLYYSNIACTCFEVNH